MLCYLFVCLFFKCLLFVWSINIKIHVSTFTSRSFFSLDSGYGTKQNMNMQNKNMPEWQTGDGYIQHTRWEPASTPMLDIYSGYSGNSLNPNPKSQNTKLDNIRNKYQLSVNVSPDLITVWDYYLMWSCDQSSTHESYFGHFFPEDSIHIIINRPCSHLAKWIKTLGF